MVCRENKGRSAIMGLHKALADLERRPGEVALTDNEYQSAIHDAGHLYEGHSAMSVDEQVEMWRGVRQLVANNPGIPEATKYRQSTGRGGQPGIITRIDQEIERLQTGTAENGRELRPEQLNKGNQIAAVQRLGVLLTRATPAKQRYLETYARHTGKTLKEAQSEWNGLMDRKGDFSDVDLTDQYRDRLTVAGLSAQAQADMGQSGKTRDTLRTMEQRRLEALEAQPKRATPRTDLRKYARPDQVGDQQKCVGEGGCGRFGHTRDVCPNQQTLAELEELHKTNVQVGEIQQMSSLRATIDDNPDGNIGWMSEELATLEAKYGIKAEDLTTKQVAAARKQWVECCARIAELHQQMDDAQPKVSTAVQKLEYSADTGLLLVTAQPYTRKGDGKTVQRSYAYRVSQEDYDRIVHAPSVGQGLSETVWRKGKDAQPNDGYKFENIADQQAAFTQRKCPTCGRWASMTSSHTCALNGSDRKPLPGDDAFDSIDTENRTAVAAYRAQFRAAIANNTPLPTKPGQVQLVMSDGTLRPLGKGAAGSLAKPDRIDKALRDGRVARTPVTVAFPDAKVDGTATVWEDETTGERIVSGAPECGGRGLSCTCPESQHGDGCKHITAALTVAQRRWGVHGRTYSRHLTPSVPLDKFKQKIAVDAPATELERTDYTKLVRARRAAIDAQRASYNRLVAAGGHVAGPRTQPPLNPATGEPVGWPHRWQRGNGEGDQIDLADSGAVQQRIRQALFSRDRKFWSVLRDSDGGMRVTVPPKRRAPDGTAPHQERARLAGLLGVPVSAVGPDGYRVPPDSSWRHDVLDRAYGDDRRLEPASWIV